MPRRAIAFGTATLLLILALAYLRDPPWLSRVESGLRGWETTADGTPYRWTDGHASFFVPATAARIAIPLRATFADNTDPPVLVSVSIDDRDADQIVLRNGDWHVRYLRMPAPGERSLRRVDIRVDRLRPGNRGVQLGEVVGER